ncbi:GM25996 [Drosophila sechellia]|uniref:GM25996 n=1 Tax=Drosophila sechellia TaxID=7238 RepID=B4HGV8_DROSE|nr:GM25996 [Drosophila sechellia]
MSKAPAQVGRKWVCGSEEEQRGQEEKEVEMLLNLEKRQGVAGKSTTLRVMWLDSLRQLQRVWTLSFP